MVVVDIAWTVAGKAGSNAHHLEMALASTADRESGSGGSVAPAAEERCNNVNSTAIMAASNDTTDIWAPYKATGLELKVFTEVSPDSGVVGVARRSSAKGQRETRGSTATTTTPVSDEKKYRGDGMRTAPPPEPLDRETLAALSNSGSTSERRPRTFPRTQGTRKERENKGDNAVDGPVRTHRHHRAESDGLPQRGSFGGAWGRKTAAAHGRSSGRLSGKLLRRSRTEICAPAEKEVQQGAANDEAGGGGGRRGGKEPDKQSPTRKLFGAGEGSGEADGLWAGSSSRVCTGEEGGGDGRVGEEVVEKTGETERGRNKSESISPLSIRVEDDDDLVGGLFVSARASRVAGVGSSGPASCPPRPSGDPGERGEGRDAFNVDHVQVRLCASSY